MSETEKAEMLAEIARLHARLEDDHVYRINPEDPDGEMVREDVAPGSIPDGIEARDATIGLLEDEIKRLHRKLRKQREKVHGLKKAYGRIWRHWRVSQDMLGQQWLTIGCAGCAELEAIRARATEGQK